MLRGMPKGPKPSSAGHAPMVSASCDPGLTRPESLAQGAAAPGCRAAWWRPGPSPGRRHGPSPGRRHIPSPGHHHIHPRSSGRACVPESVLAELPGDPRATGPCTKPGQRTSPDLPGPAIDAGNVLAKPGMSAADVGADRTWSSHPHGDPPRRRRARGLVPNPPAPRLCGERSRPGQPRPRWHSTLR